MIILGTARPCRSLSVSDTSGELILDCPYEASSLTDGCLGFGLVNMLDRSMILDVLCLKRDILDPLCVGVERELKEGCGEDCCS